MPQIRRIRPDETPFLEQMLYEALFVPPGNPPYTRAITAEPSLQKYISNWANQPGDVALVLEDKDQLAGAVWGRCFSANDPSYGFVAEDIPEISIAIQSAYRNQGWGAKMIEAICFEYSQLGYSAISLSVDQISPAKNLYLRQGFQIHKEAGTAFTMIRKL